MKPVRLCTKVIIGFCGLTVLLGVALFFLIRSEFSNFMVNELRKRGTTIARHLAEAAIQPILTENRLKLRALVSDYTKNEKDIRYIYVVNSQQEILAHTFDTTFPVDLLKSDRALPPGKNLALQTLQTDNERIVDITVPMQPGELGRVHVGMSQQVIHDNLNHLLQQLLPVTVTIICLAILVAFLFAASITRPLAQLAAAANQIAGGNRNVKVAINSRDEIGELAAAFNRMIDELAVQQQQLEALNCSLEERISTALIELRQRDQALIAQSRMACMGEMINNIAHQWRQPLNNVGMIIQNLKLQNAMGELSQEELKNDVDNAMEIIYFMSRTIDDFRNFFRQDKNAQVFSINKVVDNALEFLTPALRNCGIELKRDEQPEVMAEGYANEYAQVLLNIIGNAKDVLLERGIAEPRINLRIFTEAGQSVVTIEDNAGGIKPDYLSKIFEPYFTTKAQSHGTGIGLYMSKVIIEQNMTGRLSVCNTGAGAEFRIEL